MRQPTPSDSSLWIPKGHPRPKNATDTNGLSIRCGSLAVGKRSFRLEIWLDNFIRIKGRYFWYGFVTNSTAGIKSLADKLPSQLGVIMRLGEPQVMLTPGTRMYQQKFLFRESAWRKTVLEEYEGESYLGQYWPDAMTKSADLQAVAKSAVSFWRQVSKSTQAAQ